jgi:hypothetical protein
MLDDLYSQYGNNLLPLKKAIDKQKNGWRYVTIIGEISAGKSSIWNWVFQD